MHTSSRHSQTGEHRGRVKSGLEKKVGKQGARTAYRAKREGQVRTVNRRELARVTHGLESIERGIIQDSKMDRAWDRDTHILKRALPGQVRQSNKSK